jgi:4-amino-4-deoxy-L-arabinose transferase-like glycosyltransferase
MAILTLFSVGSAKSAFIKSQAPPALGVDKGPRHTLCLSLLSLYCGYLFFYGLTAGELWRSENLRALVAREILESGNWVVPTLYHQPLFSKPPLFYAAIALVSRLAGGLSEWSARFPSAAAASITAILFYWYFSRQLGRLAGLVTAAILPASFMWLDKATVAEIDMMHVAWTTAALLFFFRALDEHDSSIPAREPSPQRGQARHREEWFWWIAALLCVAGGFLTKWTTPVFFYATAITLLALRGQMQLLFCRQHLISTLPAAGLCLAWATAAIALAGWEPFYNVVSREALARIFPADYGGSYRWSEVLVYPFRIFATNLPWSVFALWAFLPGFAELWDERGRRLWQALNAWLWPNLLIWTFVAEHTPRHSFPMYPAVSGLAAMVWVAWLTGRLHWTIKRFHAAPALASLLVLWLGVKLVHVEFVAPYRNGTRQPVLRGFELAAVVPENQTLYVFQLKDRDEGILFYYGRPVERLSGPEALPLSIGPAYCLLDEDEWRNLRERTLGKVVLRLAGEQAKPLVVMRIDRLADDLQVSTGVAEME